MRGTNKWLKVALALVVSMIQNLWHRTDGSKVARALPPGLPDANVPFAVTAPHQACKYEYSVE